MKKLINWAMMALMMLSASTVVTACGDDSDDSGASYTGQWIYDDGSNEVVALNLSTASGTLTEYEILGQHSVRKATVPFTLTVTGNRFTIEIPAEYDGDTLSGTWTVSGNTLTISFEGKTIAFKRPTSEQKADMADWDKYATSFYE